MLCVVENFAVARSHSRSLEFTPLSRACVSWPDLVSFPR